MGLLTKHNTIENLALLRKQLKTMFIIVIHIYVNIYRESETWTRVSKCPRGVQEHGFGI